MLIQIEKGLSKILNPLKTLKSGNRNLRYDLSIKIKNSKTQNILEMSFIIIMFYHLQI